MQDAYGKAKDKAAVAADRTKIYLDDAKKYLAEAKEKMGGVATKARTADDFDITSEVGKGSHLIFTIHADGKNG